jgi:cobalt-zinc-cadmium efflux system outer membrane protein
VTRWRTVVFIVAACSLAAGARAQEPSPRAPATSPFIDRVDGLSLADAIGRALASEPGLAMVRAQVDVAAGLRVQAGLRPNPSVLFEQRAEPGGTDSQTMLTAEWPLDLFRRAGRQAVADAEVGVAGHAIADRERRLTADVRTRYGEVLVAVRDLEVLDRAIDAATRQRDLVAARVDQGTTPALERDMAQTDVLRLGADRQIQVGRAEAALFELKRQLGLPADAPLALRDTLEAITAVEAGAVSPAAGEGPATRPDVREADARVAMADAAIDKAARDGRIDMSLYGTYTRMDAGFPQLGFAPDGGVERVRGVFHYAAGGVRILLPLANRNQGTLAAARADRAGAEAARSAALLSAEAETAAATARDRRAQAALQIYRAGLTDLARKNLSVMQQSYELGRSTLLDVLGELRRYLDVERAYSEAMRLAYEARTARLLATGGGR